MKKINTQLPELAHARQMPKSSSPDVQFEGVAQRSDYWDSYYEHDGLIKMQPPSQFAAFIASECMHTPLFVDVGCGSGRDTFFFAQMGHSTLGIDGSESAISHCKRSFQVFDRGAVHHEFQCLNVLELSSNMDWIEELKTKRKTIYSRFFLHAITEFEQAAFLDFAFNSMQQEDILALEFRTLADAYRNKVTGAHYRRYIDAQELVQQLTQEYPGRLLYFAEGTGMAKYKTDDAHVARILIART